MVSGMLNRPWLHGFAELRDDLCGLTGSARLERLNALARQVDLHTVDGQPLRFVDASDLPAGVPYEEHIGRTGRVPTRACGDGAVHDLYNALIWLRWPKSKAMLNALHRQARDRVMASDQGASARGPVRDRLTLFDESGLIWVCDDAAINAALRSFNWHELFVGHRARLERCLTVAVFGHAVLQKLERPYKAITAHALILGPEIQDRTPEAIDRLLAIALTDLARSAGQPREFVSPGLTGAGTATSTMPGPAVLCPIPVLGLPGWSHENQDPGFYADEKIFRRGRRHGLQSVAERVGRSLRVHAPGEEGPDSGGQGAG